MATKLEQINKTLMEILKLYQTLLLRNEEATKKAIDSLKETDRMVAISGITLIK